MLADIRDGGDEAVLALSQRLDDWSPESFRLSPEQIETIMATLPQQVIDDITFAQTQIRNFARIQQASIQDVEVKTLPGVFMGQLITGLHSLFSNFYLSKWVAPGLSGVVGALVSLITSFLAVRRAKLV